MATYKINVRRYYHWPTSVVTEHLDRKTGQPWRGTFENTLTEANSMIKGECGLAPDEYNLPSYTIATVTKRKQP